MIRVRLVVCVCRACVPAETLIPNLRARVQGTRYPLRPERRETSQAAAEANILRRLLEWGNDCEKPSPDVVLVRDPG